MKKRITSICLIILMLCAMCGTSVFAAELPSENMVSPMYLHNDYFTGGTGTMNSIAGSQSKIFNSSSGSISANARVTNVELNVTVSRGSIPFYIVVESPNGYQAERYISTRHSIRKPPHPPQVPSRRPQVWPGLRMPTEREYGQRSAGRNITSSAS